MGGRVLVLVLVLASTRPVVSGASLTVHARPKAWECGAYRRYFHASSRFISSAARAVRRVPGLLDFRTARLAFPLGR